MTYCTRCGTPQESGDRFCTGCGSQVSAASSTRLRPRGQVVAVLTALVLLIGGGAAAWATLTHHTTPSALPPPNTASFPNRPQDETFTSPAVDPPSVVDPEDAARDRLTELIALDGPQVQSEIAETWVPQLSSKRPGLVVEGVSYGYTDILNDHLALRSTYSALLVWSGNWSSFGEKDFYVTVAAVPFSAPAEANAWCDRQALVPDDCFAKRLSTFAGPDGSTVNR